MKEAKLAMATQWLDDLAVDACWVRAAAGGLQVGVVGCATNTYIPSKGG